MGIILPGCAALCLVLKLPAAGETPPPIIDMHLHAHSLVDYGGGMRVCTNDQTIVFPGADPRRPMTIDRLMTCKSPVPAAATDEAVMTESLAMQCCSFSASQQRGDGATLQARIIGLLQDRR